MSTIYYEQNSTHINSNNDILRINYTKCSPPTRLIPKGTVILLHDFFRTSYQFRYVTDLLAMGGYITLAPDLPGSFIWPQPRQDARITSESLAEDLSRLVEAVHGDSPVHLVGSGFGALIATHFAASNPKSTLSITCSNLEALFHQHTDHLQSLLSLHPSSAPAEISSAISAYLQPNADDDIATGIFPEDIAEYAEALAKPGALLRMQIACRTATTSFSTDELAKLLSLAGVPTLQFSIVSQGMMDCSLLFSAPQIAAIHEIRSIDYRTGSLPEEAPEDFVLPTLLFLNARVYRGKEGHLLQESSLGPRKARL